MTSRHRMASGSSADSPFHAKQIVFLFMAATVVAVVVFLCGVLVGRGVPLGGSRARGADQAGLGSRAIDDLPPPPLSTPSSEPSAAARTSDDLSYPRRLSSGMRGSERVGDVIPEPAAPTDDVDEASPALGGPVSDDAEIESPAGPEPVSEEPVSDDVEFESPAAPEPVSEEGVSDDVEVESPAVPEPISEDPVSDDRAFENPVIPEGAYVAQVIALTAPAPAQRIAGALVDKGFQAFVLEPFPDDPVAYYRVRVGPFSDKADAERILERLRTEEGLDPYIVP